MSYLEITVPLSNYRKLWLQANEEALSNTPDVDRNEAFARHIAKIKRDKALQELERSIDATLETSFAPLSSYEHAIEPIMECITAFLEEEGLDIKE